MKSILTCLLVITVLLLLHGSCTKKDTCISKSDTIRILSNSDTTPFAVKDTDGNVYPVIKIGNQYWMAANLRVSHYRDGDPIFNVGDSAQWINYGNTHFGAWCNYNNDFVNGAVYGKLYNWYAVNDPRGLAPKGWHIPTNKDWDTLIANLTKGQEGQELKSIHFWKGDADSLKPNRDKYRFSALPGGRRFDDGNFYFLTSNGYFWSSSEFDRDTAYYQRLSFDSLTIGRFRRSKIVGNSILCVRD